MSNRNRQLIKRDQPPARIERPEQPASDVEQKAMHFNYLQLLCFLIGAQYTSVVAGRGTGKTLGILAPKLHRLLEKLHRSSIVLVGATYVQLLTRTGPELIDGMRRLGYVDNVDFWLRRFPDKKYNVKMPHNTPIDPQHSLFFRNPGTDCVSAIRLVSQDRPGSANGLSVSAIIGDEAKLLNKAKLDSEVMAINRGGQENYKGIAEHHSVTFTTDMPTTRDTKWILADRDECLKPHHQKAIELILSVQLELYRERQKLLTSVRNAARMKRIEQLERYLNELRRGLVHYAAASSFANVHALTLAYFRERERTFSAAAFKAYILNQEPEGVENGYYPALNLIQHCYDATDYRFLDAKGFTKTPLFDCRQDEDLDHDQPLTIGMDYGSSFNCMAVGQRFSRFHPKNASGFDEVRYLKSFHVEHPELVQAVVAQFVEYYRYFYKKEVTYVFDPTAVGKNGLTAMTYASEVIAALEKAGWTVKQVYFKQVPSQHSRYLAWGWCLSEKDARFSRQRFNRENMRIPLAAMGNARVIEGKKGFEKDKEDEQAKDIDQSTTTHYTDAVDILFWYLTIIEPGRLELLPAILGH